MKFFAVLCLAPFLAAAQTGYRVETWAGRNGIALSEIRAILQSRDGYLWLGTRNGLLRFDGVRFRLYDRKSTSGLTENWIRTLAETPDGTLWLGTDGGGLCRLNGSRAQCLTNADGLSQNYVRALALRRAGGLWVATGGKGIDRYDGTFTHAGLPLTTVATILEDHRGVVWAAAGRDGLWRSDRGLLPPKDITATALLQDRDGQVWAATTSGLVVFREGGTRRLLDGVRILALCEASDGSIWAGGGAGQLYQIPRQGAPVRQSFQKEEISAIFADREENIWLGTNTALHRLTQERVKVHEVPQVRGMLASADGSVLVGTESTGVLRISRQGAVTRVAGLPDQRSGSMVETAGDVLWAATPSGLIRWAAGKAALVGEDQPALRRVSAMAEDRKGLIVASALGGLFRWDGSRFHASMEADTLRTGYIHSFFVDRDGATWAAAQNGLFPLGEGRGRQYLPKVAVHSVHQDRRGVFRLATRRGLARLADGRVSVYLPDGLVLHVLDDGAGFLWLHTETGVVRVAQASLEDLLDGRVNNVSAVRMGVAEGVAGFTTYAHFSSCRTGDGRLWFGTRDGVAEIDPANLKINQRRPPVMIEEVLLDGRPIAGPGPFDVPAGARRLELRYTALSLTSPGQVLFRHLLEGAPTGWSQPSPLRSATFEDLPAGQYRFRLTAANNDGIWNDSGAVADFRVQTPFWRGRLFLLLVAGAIGMLFAAGARVRERTIRRQYAAILEERTRIARELHDTVEQALAGISLQLQTIQAKLRTSPEATQRSIDVAHRMTAHAMAEARRSVWDLRPLELENQDLAGALQQLAVEYRSKVQVAVDGAPRRLSAAAESNLLRIAQEAIANAMKHSGGSRVEVQIAFQPGLVRLRVRDDGKGFIAADAAESSLAGHFGILGMRERARRIGARLSLESAPGQGAEIRVELPA